MFRSGAGDWTSADAYYRKNGHATDLPLTEQPKKDSLYILSALEIEQVGGDFVLVRNKVTRNQWLLIPDDPTAFSDKIISGLVVHAVGQFIGAKPFEKVSGALENLPMLRTFAVETTFGFINLEDPALPQAWKEEVESARIVMEEEAKEKAQEAESKKKAQAVREEQAKNSAVVSGAPALSQGNSDSTLLPRARAQLAEVVSKIDSQRKRYAEARDVINTLTKNKTVPVKEGSQPYYRCMAASKVINEIEDGAPALKAEQAKLETLVNELEKQSR